MGEGRPNGLLPAALKAGMSNGPTAPAPARRRIKFLKAKKRENGFVTLNSTDQPHKGGKSEGVRGNKSGKKFSHSVDEAGLPLPEGGLFPESKILQVMRWAKVRPTGPGFYNLGNTCFLNATLQCLGYLPPLAQFLLGRYQAGINSRMGNVPVDMLKMLQDLMVLVHLNPGGNGHPRGAISPKALVSNLKVLNRQFRLGRQEDAHEFLRHLIDALQNQCLKAEGVKSTAAHRLADTTFIHRIFAGYLRSQVKCTDCGYCSNTYEPFMDLSLEITGKIHTLSDALARFTAIETLDKANRWRCSSCNKLVCAQKQLTIYKAPNVLTIQFKRFMFGSRSSKISKGVAFPETFRLPVTGSREPNHYVLTGVLVHAGISVNAGHYYAFVRGSNQLWYQMDDSRVMKHKTDWWFLHGLWYMLGGDQVNLKTTLAQHAYLLFYTKVVPQAPDRPLAPAVAANGRETPRALATIENGARQGVPLKEEQGERKEQKQPPPAATASVAVAARGEGWGGVFAHLDHEDKKEKDHAADLRPKKEEVDSSWAQPETLASFVDEIKKKGLPGMKSEEEEGGRLNGLAFSNKMKGEQLPPSPVKSTSSESTLSLSSWAVPPEDLGKLVMGYSYIGPFYAFRFSRRRRWRRVFSPWPKDRREEEDSLLGEKLLENGDSHLGQEEEEEDNEGLPARGERRKRRVTGGAMEAAAELELSGKRRKLEESSRQGQEAGRSHEGEDKRSMASLLPPPQPPALPPSSGPAVSGSYEDKKKSKNKKKPEGQVVSRQEEGTVILVRRKRPVHEEEGHQGGSSSSFLPSMLLPKPEDINTGLGFNVGSWDMDDDQQKDLDELLAAREREVNRLVESEKADKRRRQLDEWDTALDRGKKKKVKAKKEEDGEAEGGSTGNAFQQVYEAMHMNKGSKQNGPNNTR